MIKFLPLDFLGESHRIPWKNKTAAYRLQISELVPERFKVAEYGIWYLCSIHLFL